MMRDEVLMELVDKAMNDGEFRRKAQENPEGTLSEYGYELTTEEMAAVKEFHSQTQGMTNEQIDRALAGNAGGQAVRIVGGSSAARGARRENRGVSRARAEGGPARPWGAARARPGPRSRRVPGSACCSP